MRLPLRTDRADLRRVLALGAHPDDIEIGCGGTILRLLEEHPGLELTWVTLTSTPERKLEAERSASTFLRRAADFKLVVADFRDGYLPYLGAEIKEFVQAQRSDPQPDLIFTHYRSDLHQDHRLVSELTWNTFRDHLILEYEIPKWDGDLGRPNLYVQLDEATCRRKIDALLECFPSQRQKRWFSEDLFLSLLRIRGMESNAPHSYAEAFHCRKAVV